MKQACTGMRITLFVSVSCGGSLYKVPGGRPKPSKLRFGSFETSELTIGPYDLTVGATALVALRTAQRPSVTAEVTFSS
jgi:hypothetical protein